MPKTLHKKVTFSHIIYCHNRYDFIYFQPQKLLSMTHHTTSGNNPDSAELALTLIGEELKSRKFFNALHELGFEYSFFQPHLDRPILSAIGLDPGDEDIFDFYSDLMDKHSQLISAEAKSVSVQAKEVYATLLQKKQAK